MYESIHSGTICPDAGAGITAQLANTVQCFIVALFVPILAQGLPPNMPGGNILILVPALSSNILQFIFF